MGVGRQLGRDTDDAVDIEVIEDSTSILHCAKRLRDEVEQDREHRCRYGAGEAVIGLDCEWETISVREGGVTRKDRSVVCTLQLSTHRYCVILRLNVLREVPLPIKELLCDPKILKVGVGVWEDCEKLYRDYQALVLGCLDLSVLYQHVSSHKPGISASDGTPLGLASLVGVLFRQSLNKDVKLRRSTWGGTPFHGTSGSETSLNQTQLTSLQIVYAASDAYYGLAVLEAIAQSSIQFSVDFWRCCIQTCQNNTQPRLGSKGLPLPPRSLGSQDSQELTENNPTNEPRNEGPNSNVVGFRRYQQAEARRAVKESRRQQWVEQYTRKSPMYDNCRLFAPDGMLLTTCDRAKLMWYVTEGLGDVVETKTDSEGTEIPSGVRLRFEPRGRGVNPYYVASKENKCVVCGATHGLVRHFVVPRVLLFCASSWQKFRSGFPSAFKSHNSHDVMALCFGCHEVAVRHVQSLPIRNLLPSDICEALDLDKLRQKSASTVKAQVKVNSDVQKAARTLLQRATALPPKRKEELVALVMTWYQEHSKELEPPDNTQRYDNTSHFDQETAEVLMQVANISTVTARQKTTASTGSDDVEEEESGEHTGKLSRQRIFGQKVVDALIKKGKENSPNPERWWDVPGDTSPLSAFIKGWRQLFLDTMQPKYLPTNWSVNERCWVELGGKLCTKAEYRQMHAEELDFEKDEMM